MASGGIGIGGMGLAGQAYPPGGGAQRSDSNPDTMMSRLMQIASVLGDAEYQLREMRVKCIGQTPEVEAKDSPPAENVSSLLMHINAQSQRIYSALSEFNKVIA
jgi:hypothetical protein